MYSSIWKSTFWEVYLMTILIGFDNILDDLGDEGLIGEWNAACKIEKRAKPEPPPTPPNNG